MQVYRLNGPDDVHVYLDWLAGVLDSGQPIAIDTETRSIHDLWLPLPPNGRGHCRLYQIGTATEAWAIDAQDWHYLIGHSQKLVASATCQVIFANAMYDQSVFRKEGWAIVPWHRVEDVVVAHRLARFFQWQHGLKPACAAEFGDWALAGQEEWTNLREAYGYTWDTVPTHAEAYWVYGCMDVCLTVLLWEALLPDLPEWYRVEMEYLRLAWDMTWRGVLIDPDAVKKADDHWAEVLDVHTEALREMGFDKPSSNKVVIEVFEQLGHEPEEFSAKTGDPSYSKFVLDTIIGLGDETLAEAAESLLAWRSTFAWRNNYGTKLLKFMDENNRIHPEINTMQARTGRSSIRNPPLQTIPKVPITRDMFIAPPGERLVCIDYASQEVRIMAALSGDPAMQEFFSSDDPDYHAYVARLAHIPRDAAKTIDYARPYGAGAATMARTAGCSVGAMEGFLAQIDEAFPLVMQWKDEVTREAEHRAEVDGAPWVQLPYGRKTSLITGREYTQAANTNVQGHGADVLKVAFCRMAAEGLDEFFVLPQHDEGILCVPEPYAVEVGRLAGELMVDTKLSIPLTTDVSRPVQRWGDKYREDEEF